MRMPAWHCCVSPSLYSLVAPEQTYISELFGLVEKDFCEVIGARIFFVDDFDADGDDLGIESGHGIR